MGSGEELDEVIGHRERELPPPPSEGGRSRSGAGAVGVAWGQREQRGERGSVWGRAPPEATVVFTLTGNVIIIRYEFKF